MAIDIPGYLLGSISALIVNLAIKDFVQQILLEFFPEKLPLEGDYKQDNSPILKKNGDNGEGSSRNPPKPQKEYNYEPESSKSPSLKNNLGNQAVLTPFSVFKDLIKDKEKSDLNNILDSLIGALDRYESEGKHIPAAQEQIPLLYRKIEACSELLNETEQKGKEILSKTDLKGKGKEILTNIEEKGKSKEIVKDNLSSTESNENLKTLSTKRKYSSEDDYFEGKYSSDSDTSVKGKYSSDSDTSEKEFEKNLQRAIEESLKSNK